MKYRSVFVVLCGAVVTASVFAQATAASKSRKRRPRRPNPALKPIRDVPGLPRVLLIGDSISIGYTLPTRKLLQGKANVYRVLANCGPTSRGMQMLDKWLADKRLGTGKWDVIHFNWGLHDLKYMPNGKQQVPINQYEKNLQQLVAKLKQTGAKLIWASTTPVPGTKVKPPRKNADVMAYNAAAKKIMDENGIVIDDLYSVVFPRLKELQRPANVHFMPQGYDVLARQVAASIRKALGE